MMVEQILEIYPQGILEKIHFFYWASSKMQFVWVQRWRGGLRGIEAGLLWSKNIVICFSSEIYEQFLLPSEAKMNQNNTSHHFNIHFKFKGTGVETVQCFLSLSWINTQMDPLSLVNGWIQSWFDLSDYINKGVSRDIINKWLLVVVKSSACPVIT